MQEVIGSHGVAVHKVPVGNPKTSVYNIFIIDVDVTLPPEEFFSDAGKNVRREFCQSKY